MQDELLWGAAWLRRASEDNTYLTYIESNGKTLGADDNTNEFGWDNKHAGLNVLVSKVSQYTHTHTHIIHRIFIFHYLKVFIYLN